MCVVSMIYDEFNKRPDEWFNQRKNIDLFRELEEMAKTIDEATGQKDCVDPEKQKLLDRIAELEKQLPPEPVDTVAVEIEVIDKLMRAMSKLPEASRKRVYEYVQSAFPPRPAVR